MKLLRRNITFFNTKDSLQQLHSILHIYAIYTFLKIDILRTLFSKLTFGLITVLPAFNCAQRRLAQITKITSENSIDFKTEPLKYAMLLYLKYFFTTIHFHCFPASNDKCGTLWLKFNTGPFVKYAAALLHSTSSDLDSVSEI